MSTIREIERLSVCGLLSKDEYVVKGFAEEIDRMMDAAGISSLELVNAINSLIDNPAKDGSGNPRFVTTSHIRGRVDYNREMDRRQQKDEDYKSERKAWTRDDKGVPDGFKACMVYLDIRDPKPEDRQKVVDAIRLEMVRHPKGSELYGLWMTAGKTWKEVRCAS